MQEIEVWVRDENILDLQLLQFDQNDILRFCRARKLDIPKIKIMVSEFAQWRKDENIDTLYETWVWPEKPAFKNCYQFAAHKTDKLGRPL